MASFFTPRTSFWAYTLVASGWLYSALAYFGPWLFHRGLIEHAFPMSMGYQFGRTIFWRLSKRAAWTSAFASLGPLLSLAVPASIRTVWLSFCSLLILAAWLTHAPGRQIGLVDGPPGQGAGALPFFELRANPGIIRPVITFLICGLIPAALFGAAVNGLLNFWMK